QPHAAAELGASEVQFVAQIPEEGNVAVPIEFTGLPVDSQLDHSGVAIIVFGASRVKLAGCGPRFPGNSGVTSASRASATGACGSGRRRRTWRKPSPACGPQKRTP